MTRTIATTYGSFVSLSGPADNPTTITADGVLDDGLNVWSYNEPWMITNAGGILGLGLTLASVGTIMNSGGISGSQGWGVNLNAGGSVTNQSGGTITGYDAISSQGAVTVVNAGSIGGYAKFAASFGAKLLSGGSVTNQSGGIISGDRGIYGASAPVTVMNAGSIPAILGVELLAGGNVTNVSGATIGDVGGAVGIDGVAGNVFVVNAGNIVSDTGIALGGGGSVTNEITGTISANPVQPGAAIYAATSFVTVVNAGSIAAPYSNGIKLASGGYVSNQSSGRITGYSVAIYGKTDPVTVVNTGGTVGNSSYADSKGVVLMAGGNVTNQSGGAILGQFIQIGPDLAPAFGVGAIVGKLAPVNVVNDAIIAGNSAAGIILDGGGSVTNQSDGMISGFVGIYNNFSAIATLVTVVNAGSIIGTAAGLYLQRGGSVTNETGGIIDGIGGGDLAAMTVVNAGSINGGNLVVAFNSGYSDRLVIDPNAVFTGDVTGGNTLGATAISTLELASGTTTGTLSGLGTKYIDFASVTIDAGAAWTLSGTQSGFATLTNAGGLASGITLGSGGLTLSNQSSGTISGNNAIYAIGTASVVNAGSIIATGLGVYLGGGGRVTNLSGGTISAGSVGVGDGELSTVVNAGVISGTSTNSVGVYLGAGGSVTNRSGGTISGAIGIDAHAISLTISSGPMPGGTQIIHGAPATVVNAGSIGGTSTSGVGVYLGGGGVVTNQSGGTITGRADAVKFAGGVSDRLEADPGAVFIGTVDGGNTIGATAVSTLELAAGSNTGTLTGLGTQFINFGSIAFDPGANWFVSGNTTGLPGTITGFAPGDTLEITGIGAIGSSYSGGMLTLTEASGSATLNLPGSFVTSDFVVRNIQGGVNVSVLQARILTWTGDGSDAMFATAANWTDVTNGLAQAQLAPVSADTAVFDSSGGAITGTGTVAALEVGASGTGALQLSNGATIVAGSLDAGVVSGAVGQIGLTDSGTDLTVTGSATIADDGTGVLSVLNGATFTAATLTIGGQSDSSGALVVSGAGSLLDVSGALNIGTALGTGDLTVGPGAVVNASVVNLQGGVVMEGGLLDPTVYIENGGSTTGGFGTIASDFILLEGTILSNGSKLGKQTEVVQGTLVGGGTAAIKGSVSVNGPGILQIGTHDTIELTGAVLNAATTTFTDNLTPTGTYSVNNSVIDVVFQDSTGVLVLDDIAGFAGTVATWKAGDSFVITGAMLSGLSVSNGDTLTVSDTGTGAGAGGIDTIIFGSAISPGGFGIVNGNTVQAVACFAAGTRIETEHGPAAVEDLVLGDKVVLAENQARHEPIVWIGRQEVACLDHPNPEAVWPVRVRAGAIGSGLPMRDLLLSPDHGVLVNGVLVPVKLLINGTRIAQVTCDHVTYFHVELPRHDVILAEGMPVESYLDTGDRADFVQSGAMRLFPDGNVKSAAHAARAWETLGAACLVVTGPDLEAARASVDA